MYPIDNNPVPGDLRRGSQHHAAITVQTPLTPKPVNPSELARQLVRDADFAIETAIGTMISQLDCRKATAAELDKYKKLIYRNLGQKIRARCHTGSTNNEGPWAVK